ncbi:hypothetical protein NO2_1553, partial [Candidatus Termititenax persephonae]
SPSPAAANEILRELGWQKDLSAITAADLTEVSLVTGNGQYHFARSVEDEREDSELDRQQREIIENIKNIQFDSNEATFKIGKEVTRTLTAEIKPDNFVALVPANIQSNIPDKVRWLSDALSSNSTNNSAELFQIEKDALKTKDGVFASRAGIIAYAKCFKITPLTEDEKKLPMNQLLALVIEKVGVQDGNINAYLEDFFPGLYTDQTFSLDLAEARAAATFGSGHGITVRLAYSGNQAAVAAFRAFTENNNSLLIYEQGKDDLNSTIDNKRTLPLGWGVKGAEQVTASITTARTTPADIPGQRANDQENVPLKLNDPGVPAALSARAADEIPFGLPPLSPTPPSDRLATLSIPQPPEVPLAEETEKAKRAWELKSGANINNAGLADTQWALTLPIPEAGLTVKIDFAGKISVFDLSENRQVTDWETKLSLIGHWKEDGNYELNLEVYAQAGQQVEEKERTAYRTRIVYSETGEAREVYIQELEGMKIGDPPRPLNEAEITNALKNITIKRISESEWSKLGENQKYYKKSADGGSVTDPSLITALNELTWGENNTLEYNGETYTRLPGGSVEGKDLTEFLNETDLAVVAEHPLADAQTGTNLTLPSGKTITVAQAGVPERTIDFATLNDADKLLILNANIGDTVTLSSGDVITVTTAAAYETQPTTLTPAELAMLNNLNLAAGTTITIFREDGTALKVTVAMSEETNTPTTIDPPLTEAEESELDSQIAGKTGEHTITLLTGRKIKVNITPAADGSTVTTSIEDPALLEQARATVNGLTDAAMRELKD